MKITITKEEFIKKINSQILVGNKYDNLKGNNHTTISENDGESIIYLRGESKIKISILELWNTYDYLIKQELKNISSIQLCKYRPDIFDSKQNGHSCNCTFFYIVLKEIGLILKIDGKGVRGNPFYINFI